MRKPHLLLLLTALVVATVIIRGPHLFDRHGRALQRAGRAVVAGAVVDLYERPDQRAVADQALLGDTVDVIERRGGFVKVRTAVAYSGWVKAALLAPLPAGAPSYGQGPGGLRVVARLANLYHAPDVTLAGPLLVAPLSSRLAQLAEVDDRWLRVALPDGQTAYVQRGDVASDKGPPPSPSCVLDEARRYEGTPYLWGGRSTLGIDCSGLVENSYSACGLPLPRDADDQYAALGLVAVASATEVAPGDLVFFGKTEAGKPPRVTHVGMVLDREGRFIHATTHDRPVVQMSRLGDAYWQKMLVGIRRHPGLQQGQGI